jgi:hypothetical protein
VEAGRTVLVNEAERQIRIDGGHAELSAHYHRYSTDFYLLALAVARRAGDPASSVFEDAARRQARFLRTIADDEGRRPQLGDDDGGQLFPVCGRSSEDCTDTLAIAATMLSEPDLAVREPPEEAYWMCGVAAAQLRTIRSRTLWRSASLDASGYYVSRTAAGDHLIFDAGPHGYLNGGHAHADALAVVLTVAGRPLLVDPGTGTYTMDTEVRDRFRSTAMHNTLVLDGRSQSEPAGPFHWRTTAAARAGIWRTTADCDYVEGFHDGYAPRRHTRGILAIHGVGWWIIDHVLGDGRVGVTIHWHLHPAVHVARVSGSSAALIADGRPHALAASIPLALLAPDADPLAFWSPVYGRIEPAPVLRSHERVALPATVATFIPAVAPLTRNLRVDVVAIAREPGDGWRGAAFRARWDGGAMILAAAIEQAAVPADASAAPGRHWGPADVMTDGRVAVLMDDESAGTHAVLINGASLLRDGTVPVVSLMERAPVARLTVPDGLASSVHGPAGGR